MRGQAERGHSARACGGPDPGGREVYCQFREAVNESTILNRLKGARVPGPLGLALPMSHFHGCYCGPWRALWSRSGTVEASEWMTKGAAVKSP